jgi:phosphoribosylglycinamide formyltransferase 2
MTSIGTPCAPSATRMLLLGSGELGKEVALEAQRLGVEVIAADRYAGAPAMQVAHRAEVVAMLDGDALEALVDRVRPDLVVPEIEAIATTRLVEMEQRGLRVIPTARAARLTMDREGIRRLAAETLGLPTSPYRFADTREEYDAAVVAIGTPCVIKPVMSSSGKGQSLVRNPADADAAWTYAQSGGRAGAGRVIVEGFIDFDYEITLLTVRHKDGTSFCDPIGHYQVDGDYRESWQPHPMSERAAERAQAVATAVTDELGGHGIFGVELFVKGDEVWFSEVSPRPHDTGLVTLISQDLSEFALHVRAIPRSAGSRNRAVRALRVECGRGRRLGSWRPLRWRGCGACRTGYRLAPVRQARTRRQAAHGRHPCARWYPRRSTGQGGPGDARTVGGFRLPHSRYLDSRDWRGFMPSFDVVSEVDLNEVTNAVDQASREIGNRYDFKGSSAKVERNDGVLVAYGDSEFQLGQVTDILFQKLAKRGIDISALEAGKIESISGDKAKQALTLRQGIGTELAKKIVRLIKDSKMKVQAAIQGEQVRVTGKKRDDLQEVIALLKGKQAELGQPLQYTNFRD